MYYEYAEAIKYIPSHRILAINRGEKEEFLKVKIRKTRRKNISLHRKRRNKRTNPIYRNAKRNHL